MVLISVYIAMLLTNWGERCTEMHRMMRRDAPTRRPAPPPLPPPPLPPDPRPPPPQGPSTMRRQAQTAPPQTAQLRRTPRRLAPPSRAPPRPLPLTPPLSARVVQRLAPPPPRAPSAGAPLRRGIVQRLAHRVVGPDRDRLALLPPLLLDAHRAQAVPQPRLWRRVVMRRCRRCRRCCAATSYGACTVRPR